MRKLLSTFLIIIFVLSLGIVTNQPQTAEAGAVSLPGGWNMTITYCTNGFTATVNVPAGHTLNVYHRVLVSMTSPSAWLFDPIVIAFHGDGNARTVSTDFYWKEEQAAGTSVSLDSIRYEDDTVIPANNTDSDTIGNCEIAPMPPEIRNFIDVDGRLNKERAQTGAVYCNDNSVEILYSISGDPREGQQAIWVSKTEISTLGVPAVDTLLESTTDGYQLWRLASGNFYFIAPGLEAGKPYTFTWTGC